MRLSYLFLIVIICTSLQAESGKTAPVLIYESTPDYSTSNQTGTTWCSGCGGSYQMGDFFTVDEHHSLGKVEIVAKNITVLDQVDVSFWNWDNGNLAETPMLVDQFTPTITSLVDGSSLVSVSLPSSWELDPGGYMLSVYAPQLELAGFDFDGGTSAIRWPVPYQIFPGGIGTGTHHYIGERLGFSVYETDDVIPEDREIEVFDGAPYDGEIQTRRIPGIEATFGYNLEGTALYAEYVVRENKTLADVAATKGYDHFNWMQIVTAFPAFGGCLSNTPYNDPQQGGCIVPYIEADMLPFYYDEGAAWEDTPYYIGDQMIEGLDHSTNEIVDVGISFADQPASIRASTENPMSFVLFPVGVFADGTYETLVTKALYWSSTNNTFFGGEVYEAVVSRSNPLPDGLSTSFLVAEFFLISDLLPAYRALLVSTGFVDTPSEVPLPAALPLLAAGLGAMGFIGWRKKRKATVA